MTYAPGAYAMKQKLPRETEMYPHIFLGKAVYNCIFKAYIIDIALSKAINYPGLYFNHLPNSVL